MFCSVTNDVGVLQWQEPAESPCNVQGRGNAAEGASEGQTFSSMESLASLTDGPENHAASHIAQPSRVPLGVSPLSKAEGAGYAAARIANGSMGYTQHLQVQVFSKNPAPTQSSHKHRHAHVICPETVFSSIETLLQTHLVQPV